MDDGGVAITHYQTSVNMSEPVNTSDTSTVATFTLNPIGEHLVQVRAVNCAGVSEYTSKSFNFTISAGVTLMLHVLIINFTSVIIIVVQLPMTTATEPEDSTNTSGVSNESLSTSNGIIANW